MVMVNKLVRVRQLKHVGKAELIHIFILSMDVLNVCNVKVCDTYHPSPPFPSALHMFKFLSTHFFSLMARNFTV